MTKLKESAILIVSKEKRGIQMTKTNANDKVKVKFMEMVKAMLIEKGEEVLQVKTGTYSIPWVKDDDEGYINITFSIPKGERGGDGYDGYEEAQNFELEQKAKLEKKKEIEARKKAKAEKDRVERENKAKIREKKEER